MCTSWEWWFWAILGDSYDLLDVQVGQSVKKREKWLKVRDFEADGPYASSGGSDRWWLRITVFSI